MGGAVPGGGGLFHLPQLRPAGLIAGGLMYCTDTSAAISYNADSLSFFAAATPNREDHEWI